MSAPDYAAFLGAKTHLGTANGFDPGSDLPGVLFDFQRELVTCALRMARSLLLADCGLGKGGVVLVWADHVVRRVNRHVLVIAPLAVAHQFLGEAEKFGVPVVLSRDGRVPARASVVVTNYERLHLFDWQDFAGAVCDESSILKDAKGVRRGQVTDFLRKLPYRLLDTATAAPNDVTELGTSSEALGYLGHVDLLNRFFKNDQNTTDERRAFKAGGGAGRARWRFKGHAEGPFWRYVASWARALRRPSDLGYDDGPFVLPPLDEREHVVGADVVREGMLFALPAVGMAEEREERRRTVRARCEHLAALAQTGQPFVAWCDLNEESALLAELLPDAAEVRGAGMSDDEKEERLTAFARGEVRGVVTKKSIAGWGLNWQHCAHVLDFASHSYEAYYQGVRRCWRFGQTRPVTVDLIATPGQAGAVANLRRKAARADRMWDALIAHTATPLTLPRARAESPRPQAPAWLTSTRSAA